MRIVRHCLNLLAHFHKMYPWTLKNSTSENQAKTKKEKKSETPRPVGKKIRNSEAQKNTRKRDFETIKKRFRDPEIGPEFSETHVFQGTIRHPFIAEPQDDFFCFIPQSLAAKYEF